VPLDQRREGRFITAFHKPVQQLPVSEADDCADLEKHP
jgi:hypothetical protein